MSRNMFLFCFFLTLLSCSRPHEAADYNLLIGTYTEGTGSEGIYLCKLNLTKDTFSIVSTADDVINPSYLTLSPDGRFVYAVSEFGTESSVHAYALARETMTLQKINEVSTVGASPCYIAATEDVVVTADYSGGSVSVFGRRSDGSLTQALQCIQHEGRSTAPNQQAPHVHQARFTPDERWLVVTDLGTDRVSVYSYNKDGGENILSPASSLKVKEGSGPRHFTFGKDGKTIYLLHENDGTVSVLSVNERGELALLQETTVARNDTLQNGAADIHISPDGRFVYATNRGNANDITCFSVGDDRLLTFVEQISTEGDGPRNFVITPDGNYILVANQRSNNITVFERNASTGRLSIKQPAIKLNAAVCLVWF